MKNLNYKLLVIIAFVIFTILGTVYITYSLVVPKQEGNNLIINSTVDGPLSFSTSGGNSLNGQVSFANMSSSLQGNVAFEANDNILITLDTDGKEGVCCSYNINWVWESSSYAYTITSGASKEYTMEITATGSYRNSSSNMVNFNYSTKAYNETQLPNYNSSSLINTLTTYTVCNNDSVLSNHVTQNLALKTRLYNLSLDQNRLKNVNLKGKVTISNVSCSARQ